MAGRAAATAVAAAWVKEVKGREARAEEKEVVTVEVVTAAEVREEARAMEVAGAAVAVRAAACTHGTSRIEHWQRRSAGRSQCTGHSRS